MDYDSLLLCFADSGKCWRVELEGSSFYHSFGLGLLKGVSLFFREFLSAGPPSTTAILS